MGVLRDIFNKGGNKNQAPPKQMSEFKNTQPLEVKASKNNKLLVDNANPNTDTSKYYQNSDLINACVSFIADIASQVEIKIYEDRNGELIPIRDKSLQQWQNNPNPFIPMSSLIKAYIQSYLITGNAYLTFEKIGGKNYESWIIDPTKVKVVADVKKYISGYIFDDQISYKSEEVIFFKNADSLNPYYGLSPLLALTDVLLVESYGVSELKSFYENSTIMNGLLKSEYPLSESQIESLRQQFNTLYGRSGESRHGFLIASNNLSFESLKVSPKDAMLLESMGITADRVLMAFKVDKALLGMSNGSSANIKEIKLNFLNNVIRPLIFQMLGVFQTHFQRVFKNENIRVKSDFSNIPEISEISESKVNAVSKMLASGIISFNEARDQLNYKPKAGVYMDSQFAPSYLSGSSPTDLITGEQVELSPSNQQPNGSISDGGADNEPVK